MSRETIARRRVRDSDVAIAALAGRNKGLITTGELSAMDLSSAAIARRVARGTLHRLHRGVYAVGHTALPRDAVYLAAVLASGRGALLSHLSALDLWGLRPDCRSTIDVSVPTNAGRRGHAGVTVHRRRALLPGDRAMRLAVPVTSLRRTVADAARLLSADEFGRVVHEARVRYGQVVEHDGPLLLSRLERDFVRLVRSAGLVAPETNVIVRGPGRAHLVDAFWVDHGLVVELDGYRFHSSRRAFERDREATADLQDAGLDVLRVTARQVAEGGRLIQRLRRRLGAA